MGTHGAERREFQRLSLENRIPGTFGDVPVLVVEIGILGARIQHAVAFAEPRAELKFAYDGKHVAMRCDVVRSYPDETGRVSGVRFLAAVGESGDHLRDMLAELVNQALLHRYDASATRLRIRTVDGDKTVRGKDAHFLAYRLEGNTWRRRNVFLPEQPSVGFTVARHEDPAEMQHLCEVYEASDDEGRQLIRLFAELSVSEALQIPPRS